MDKDKGKSRVFEVLFNDNIHECAFITLSIHRTPKGAEMALAFDKHKRIEEERKTYDPLGADQYYIEEDDIGLWRIRETELKD